MINTFASKIPMEMKTNIEYSSFSSLWTITSLGTILISLLFTLKHMRTLSLIMSIMLMISSATWISRNTLFKKYFPISIVLNSQCCFPWSKHFTDIIVNCLHQGYCFDPGNSCLYNTLFTTSHVLAYFTILMIYSTK